MQTWMGAEKTGQYDAAVQLPDAIGWDALDQSADEIWQSALGSGIYRGVQLDGSSGKTLEEELVEVRHPVGCCQ